MSAALDAVVELLDLEQIELNIFRGRSPEGERRQRVFGGQVAGQALVAAGRTVPADRPVNSLHAYFIRPGDPTVPLVYLVERVRDGRSFSTRRVTVVQHGKTIFTLSASFQQPEDGGFEHFVPMPEVPAPDEVEPTSVRLRRLFGAAADEYARDNPIDIRHVGPLSVEVERDPSLAAPNNIVWLRADGKLPDDPLLHVCLMTYASDMTLLDTVLQAHSVSWAEVSAASLDHAMWFHRPFRADQWLLYAQDSPSATGGRGLARGEVYTEEGELVVSVVQEGLLRRRPRS
jgi:acyl-CoA thioesterase II